MQTRQKEINTENITLHSQKAIGLATFIGGPAAAGYLIRENYKALDETEKGNKALIISIVAMVAIFALLFTIPENIIDKIPKVIIPAIYTGLTLFWVEKEFGSIFKQHEENKYAFFSRWRAAGIGIVSLIIILLALFGYIYTTTDYQAESSYISKIEQFVINEEESLKFYDHIETASDAALLLELNEKVIPAWKENIEIINSTETIENLPDDLKAQNKELLKYCELRLEVFDLFKKAIQENTDTYNAQIGFLHAEIDKKVLALSE